jgi:phosphatidylinositol phospholipase C delta
MGEAHMGIPSALAHGVPMLKISSKKIKQVIMRLSDGEITWAGANNSKGEEFSIAHQCKFTHGVVPICQIRELRLGQPPTETYNSNRWITVVHVRGSQWKVLHMIALTDDAYEMWVSTLRMLVSETADRLVSEIKPADPDLLWIRQLWPSGAKVIDMATAVGILRQVGLVIPDTLTLGYKDHFGMSDFRQLVKDAQTRPELEALSAQFAVHGSLGRVEVENFLRGVQKVSQQYH